MNSNLIKGMLISTGELECLVEKLAYKIVFFCQEHKISRVVFIMILKGSFIFAGDLLRKIHQIVATGGIELEIITDGIGASSYEDETTGKEEVIIDEVAIKRIRKGYQGQPKILLEDIVERGLTVNKLIAAIADLDNTFLCALLDKPAGRQMAIHIDFLGKPLASDFREFVVGYGMGWGDLFRHLPHIAILNQEKLPQKTKVEKAA